MVKEKNILLRRQRIRRFGKTKHGLLSIMYASQCFRSREKGRPEPAYCQKELLDRYLEDPVYCLLYEQWVKSGYSKALKPSLDRIDNSKGYSFDNVRMTTWAENLKKETDSKKKPIKVFKNNVLVKICESVNEAASITPHDRTTVSKAKDKGKPTSSGYLFVSVDKSELDYYSKIV